MRRSVNHDLSAILRALLTCIWNWFLCGYQHPSLEKIEKDNLAIQKERYDIVFRRRYEDDSDDVSLFTGASVSSTYRIDDSIPEIEEEEFDELGRTRREFDKGPRSVTRVSRRADRERRTADRREDASRRRDGEDDGTWTDDDLTVSDSIDLSAALTSLRESLLSLFSDVKADDFRNPDLGIRRRFEEWRSKFGEEYANAFGGLALVGVWEFWARVEMALWNPFEVSFTIPSSAILSGLEVTILIHCDIETCSAD